ncbi:hypothetical protein SAMN02745124_04506, partial [Desulfofustis glycolicus DSM 9705]
VRASIFSMPRIILESASLRYKNINYLHTAAIVVLQCDQRHDAEDEGAEKGRKGVLGRVVGDHQRERSRRCRAARRCIGGHHRGDREYSNDQHAGGHDRQDRPQRIGADRRRDEREPGSIRCLGDKCPGDRQQSSSQRLHPEPFAYAIEKKHEPFLGVLNMQSPFPIDRSVHPRI